MYVYIHAYMYVCSYVCSYALCQSIKIKTTNMYIASARAHSKLPPMGVEIDTCAQTGFQLSSAASVMLLGLCF